MKLSREFTTKVRFLTDELLPPIVRDSEWFSKLLMSLALGKNYRIFYEFKGKAMKMSQQEFADLYRRVYERGGAVERATDLNVQSIERIKEAIVGNGVLEVGCGGGYLVGELSKSTESDITATDINISKEVVKKYPNAHFQEAAMEALPFPDNAFDTTITTHTIEHVRDLSQAINELRRVTKRRLVIVTPKQRPYRRTVDLHLHFFAYPESLLAFMGPNRKNFCEVVGGDLFYVEDLETHI